MSSERVRELAEQLVARADILIQEGEPRLLDEHASFRTDLVRRRLYLPGRVRDPAATLFLCVALVGSATATVLLSLADVPTDWGGFGVMLLRTTGAWALAFAPGWVFVRFSVDRLRSIWNEYVDLLYRLRVDDPGKLPRPPLDSPYYAAWRADGGERSSRHRNIYRDKFDAHYGRAASDSAENRLRRIHATTLLPVFLLIVPLAISWTVVLWYLPPVDLSHDSDLWWNGVALGFVGAYISGVASLTRRFLENDLRAGAYVSTSMHMLLVVAVVAVAQPLVNSLGVDASVQVALSFVLGLSSVSIARVLRWTTTALWQLVVMRSIPSLQPEYPLADLDGMTVWDESRLIEEGIEDMQSLVTAGFVDVFLHTRVSPARIIDWMDQAYLLLHLPKDRELRKALRQSGIRTATQFLRALPVTDPEPGSTRLQRDNPTLQALLQPGITEATLLSLVQALRADHGLMRVYNWQSSVRESPDPFSDPAADGDRGVPRAESAAGGEAGRGNPGA
jgi:hypothetical protein